MQGYSASRQAYVCDEFKVPIVRDKAFLNEYVFCVDKLESGQYYRELDVK